VAAAAGARGGALRLAAADGPPQPAELLQPAVPRQRPLQRRERPARALGLRLRPAARALASAAPDRPAPRPRSLQGVMVLSTQRKQILTQKV